jgi:hypothetical protein
MATIGGIARLQDRKYRVHKLGHAEQIRLQRFSNKILDLGSRIQKELHSSNPLNV